MKPRRVRYRSTQQTYNPPGSRPRCYGCFRPLDRCFCHAIPQIENRTSVLLVQHHRERFHPFNTARIVNRALLNSELWVGDYQQLAEAQLPLMGRSGLLFPGAAAELLHEIPPDQLPKQLVVIDGTWQQAKSLLRQAPQLQRLPRYQLRPSEPGRYRIRLEPTETSLSTLEATAAALKILEPSTDGIDQLLQAFDTMVEAQLDHPAAQYNSDPGAVQESINTPYWLQQSPERVVVAYGEPLLVKNTSTDRASRKRDQMNREPVFFAWQRLTSGRAQSAALRTRQRPMPDFLQLMKLDPSRFESALTAEQFREAWSREVGGDDHVVAFNHNTLRLLRTVGIQPKNTLTIKSINFDPRKEFDSLGHFLAFQNVPVQPDNELGRAGQRLANAVALLQELAKRRAEHPKQS